MAVAAACQCETVEWRGEEVGGEEMQGTREAARQEGIVGR